MGAILWLASYPRSGNTWTRSFLHNLIQLLEGREPEAEGGEGHDINAMRRLTTWEIGGDWYRPLLDEPEDLKAVPRERQAAVRPAAQQKIAAAVENMIFVKTHHALVESCGQPTINFKVTAGAVYIVRNPLDVAVSYARHFDISLDEAIGQMNRSNFQIPATRHSAYEHYGSWSENVESWTRRPHRAIYVMRYEDMLERPTETFRRLAHHLLMQPDERQLDRAIELSSFERLVRQEEAVGFQEKPQQSRERFFRAGRADQWKEQLSAAQVEALATPNRAQMARFGYLPEGF